MKGRIISLIITLSLALTFSGCKKANNNVPHSDASKQRESNGNRMQFAPADLTGEIAEISGSELTLKIIAMPQTGRRTAPENRSTNQNGSSAYNGNAAEERVDSSGSRENARRNSEPPGVGQGFRAAREYTGEVKTLTLSQELKITAMSRSESGIAEVQVAVDSLKAGDLLQIYYAEDGKTIEKIVLSNFPGGRGDRSTPVN
jgi:hypothetical protein